MAREYGGTTEVTVMMALFQTRSGIDAEIATTHKKGERKAEAGDVKIHSFQSCLGEYKFSWPLATWLRKNVKNYDVIHTHSIFCFSNLPAAYYAKKFGVPLVFSPHGTLYKWSLEAKKRWIKRIYLFLFKKYELGGIIHFATENEKQNIGLKTLKNGCYVLPLGIDTQKQSDYLGMEKFYDLFPFAKGKKVILYLARIHPKKGLDVFLLKIADILKENPDWVIVVAGYAKEKDFLKKLKKLVSDFDLQKQVFFLEEVDELVKQSLFQYSDVYTLPSHTEDFGISTIEAMSAGLPALISENVGTSDYIRKGNAGIIYTLDKNSICRAFKEIMDDEKRKKKSENAKKLALDIYDWRKITKRQIEIYENIIEKTSYKKV
jgi:glycosyltransferase involved in cell wall biosynthesis